MIPFIIFYSSGAIIALLIFAKVWESKRDKPFFFLSVISKSDARLRQLSHDATHAYSEYKERGEFFFKKQLPLRARSFWNKVMAWVKNNIDKHVGDIRNTRLLNHKKDGISEFFRNISNNESDAAYVPDMPVPTEAGDEIIEEGIGVINIPEIEVVEEIHEGVEAMPKRVVRRKKKDII